LKEYTKQIFKEFYHLTDEIKKEYGYERNHTEVLNEEVLSSAKRPVRHGPLHVSRVAYYIPLLTNFLRKSGDKEAAKLSQEELQAMQIAGVLHDSGRESDLTGDAPYSDSEKKSFSNCLGFMESNNIIDMEKALKICKAAGTMDSDGPSVYRRVIKSADSLDVLRADDFQFDPNKMEIYSDASPEERKNLNEIIDAVKKRIVTQGDSPQNFNSLSQKNRVIAGNFDVQKRENLQNGDIYNNIEMSMNQSPMLSSFYNQGTLIPPRKSRSTSFKEMLSSTPPPQNFASK